MSQVRFFAALFFALILSAVLSAAEALKSGPQPGEELPSSFEPLVVTGENAGKNHCLVCENGLNPCVMIFARNAGEPLLKLLASVESECKKHRIESLGAFAVFLSKDTGLEKQLVDAAAVRGLEQVVLSIDAPEGPDGYKLAKDAEVTVVFYSRHMVKLNTAYKKDELSDDAIKKFLADVTVTLSEK